MDLLRSKETSNREVFFYSTLVAFVLAQFTMALNYWPFASVKVALVLLVGFYLLVGLTQQIIRGEVGIRRVVEYIFMFAVAIAIIFFYK